MLAYFLVYLDLAIMSTATPSITSTFDSIVDIGWYGGAYRTSNSRLRFSLWEIMLLSTAPEQT